MPVEYVAFESANQIKLVFVGLNTSNDVASKYEMIMNLDGIIIEGNSNVKLTITSIESGDIDLSEYATKEELNDYALKSELPDVSELVTQTELASKQNVLISGTTIRTLNGVSLLGSGDIQFEEGSGDYTNISNKPSINGVELSGNKTSDDLGLAAKSDIPDVSEFVKESELPTQYIVEEGAALQAGDEQHEFNIKSGGRVTVNSNNEVVTYTPYPGETGRKMLVLANNDSLTGTKTDGTGAPLAFMSKWDKIEIGNSTTSLNLNSLNGEITINDDKILATVDQIQAPYEINLTNLLSAEDSESISTAIGGINNLNATVQDNRIIVGTISNGSVSVSIRILGNVTTLYYLLDSVLGLTLNEVAITNTSGTLSKSVTTHSVLTENMVINSLNSDETTLPLSAAQGKALNNKIDSIDVSADITNAINALDSSGQTTSAGEVISSVSQENGIISVSKKTLVSDDIPEIPQSKITNLSTDITAKQNKTDDALNTEDKTIVGAINEIFPKATGVGQKFNNGTGEIFNNYDVLYEAHISKLEETRRQIRLNIHNTFLSMKERHIMELTELEVEHVLEKEKARQHPSVQENQLKQQAQNMARIKDLKEAFRLRDEAIKAGYIDKEQRIRNVEIKYQNLFQRLIQKQKNELDKLQDQMISAMEIAQSSTNSTILKLQKKTVSSLKSVLSKGISKGKMEIKNSRRHPEISKILTEFMNEKIVNENRVGIFYAIRK